MLATTLTSIKAAVSKQSWLPSDMIVEVLAN